MTARTVTPLLAASLALALLAGRAEAQTAPPAPPSVQTPGTEAPIPQTPGDAAPPAGSETCTVNPGDTAGGTTSDGQMLTDQLDDCESVLIPQTDGDPDMDAPVPDADPGTTPVIPPGSIAPQPPQAN
ncbi:hypothetical protein [Aureimonas sp. AU20]|uniref:hypothetical protein n=1 Tax=Aureimonas sp. AU20 TaxID=1349819 RepID=UPI00071EE197|nr:hypothetical protein [Aureimonas sp. AU20]ALN71795.1 hypothetical protein M673_03660 [Aureimonas sp. AU20]